MVLTEAFRGPSVSLHEKQCRLPIAPVSDERFVSSGSRQPSDIGVVFSGRLANPKPCLLEGVCVLELECETKPDRVELLFGLYGRQHHAGFQSSQLQ
jgi:hypothetical protein